jgi:hypothetical protein
VELIEDNKAVLMIIRMECRMISIKMNRVISQKVTWNRYLRRFATLRLVEESGTDYVAHPLMEELSPSFLWGLELIHWLQ